MKAFYDFIRLFFFLLLQLVLENIIQISLESNLINISFSFIFIIGLSLLIFFNNFRLLFLIQIVLISAYLFILLPHFYFFNFIAFYSRYNYIFLNSKEFLFAFILIILFLIVIYFFSKLQFYLQKNIPPKKIGFFILILVIIKLCIGRGWSNDTFNISLINRNKFYLFKEDYIEYNLGINKAIYYTCDGQNSLSPSIKNFMNVSNKRELLLIIESWGELAKSNDQAECIKYLQNLLNAYINLQKYYNISFNNTCFHGNTSSAEGRELLNFGCEESYIGFLNRNVSSKYNLVDFKIRNGYHTIAAFSGSKEYGITSGNAEGFRKKLGFKSRFYFEELKEKLNSTVNHESPYLAVNDENMIDSLFKESTKYSKVFAYGLTINTHTPFGLDETFIKQQKYLPVKNTLINYFDNNQYAFNQFYRISELINYIFNQLDSNANNFDAVLIIGDHAYPDFRCKGLYNQTRVPYILIKKK